MYNCPITWFPLLVAVALPDTVPPFSLQLNVTELPSPLAVQIMVTEVDPVLGRMILLPGADEDKLEIVGTTAWEE